MRRTVNYHLRERRRGRNLSLLLHVFILLAAVIGLPNFLAPPPPEEPYAITVELLPVTGITNVKPADKPPAPEKKPMIVNKKGKLRGEMTLFIVFMPTERIIVPKGLRSGLNATMNTSSRTGPVIAPGMK